MFFVPKRFNTPEHTSINTFLHMAYKKDSIINGYLCSEMF